MHKEMKELGHGQMIPCICLTIEKINDTEKELINQKENNDSIPKNILTTFLNKCKDKDILKNNIKLGDKNIKNDIILNDNNHCIMLSFEQILHELLLSYSKNKNIKCISYESKKNILKQIKLDFNRMEIKLNSKKCKRLKSLRKNILKFKEIEHSIMSSVYYLILIFCTQASFFYQYQILHDIFTNLDHHIHIVPTDDDKPTIDIIINNECIDMIFNKKFKYVNVETNDLLANFNTYMMVSIPLAAGSEELIYVNWFKDDI